METELDALLGKSDGDADGVEVFWWPSWDLSQTLGGYFGEWTASCETWFTGRWELMVEGKAWPLTRRQWTLHVQGLEDTVAKSRPDRDAEDALRSLTGKSGRAWTGRCVYDLADELSA